MKHDPNDPTIVKVGKFPCFPVADISTAHVFEKDSDLLDDDNCPHLLAQLSFDRAGCILWIGTELKETLESLRAFGFSENFLNLIGELHAANIRYVRFDRDGLISEELPILQ